MPALVGFGPVCEPWRAGWIDVAGGKTRLELVGDQEPDTYYNLKTPAESLFFRHCCSVTPVGWGAHSNSCSISVCWWIRS